MANEKGALGTPFNFGGTNTTRDDQYKLDGAVIIHLGKSYGESWKQEPAQKPGLWCTGIKEERGWNTLKPPKVDQPTSDLMEGLDISWNRQPAVISLQNGWQHCIVIRFYSSWEISKRISDALWKTECPSRWQLENEKNTWSKETDWAVQRVILLMWQQQSNTPQTDSVRLNFVFNNRLGSDTFLCRYQPTGWTALYLYRLIRIKHCFRKQRLCSSYKSHPHKPYWLAAKRKKLF